MEEKKFMTKEELVEKAKELAEKEDLKNVAGEVANLKKQWRRGYDEDESLYDREMADAFHGYLDKINAKESEILASVEDTKKEIINKAKEVLNVKNFKKATDSMNALMDEWKAAGRANKEADDALWAQFKEVRDQFFANKKAYFAELREGFAQNKAGKEALIERAKEANTKTNFKEIGTIMDGLMEEWKKLGSAGKENDDTLWKAFSDERKSFFNKRNAYFDSLKETYSQRAEAKKEIIAQAKKCLAHSEFTDEEVETMKKLRNDWKAVGNAGRENEETLWNEFNEVMKIYFENMKYYR